MFRPITLNSIKLQHSKCARPRRPGFTLIEIMIVVVIIGILAAIALPMFSNSSNIARENTLRDDLRFMRTQIAVYSAQHQDQGPGYLNGTINTPVDATFVSQMTSFTDVAGNTSATLDSTHCLGPYLSHMPPNPTTGNASIKIINTSPATSVDDTTGWLYNPATQEFAANSSQSDSNGSPFIQY